MRNREGVPTAQHALAPTGTGTGTGWGSSWGAPGWGLASGGDSGVTPSPLAAEKEERERYSPHRHNRAKFRAVTGARTIARGCNCAASRASIAWWQHLPSPWWQCLLPRCTASRSGHHSALPPPSPPSSPPCCKYFLPASSYTIWLPSPCARHRLAAASSCRRVARARARRPPSSSPSPFRHHRRRRQVAMAKCILLASIIVPIPTPANA